MSSAIDAFVTGGTGFVGSHFVLRLLGEGCGVVALARGNAHEHARARVCQAVESAARSHRDLEPIRPEDSTLLEAVRGDITLSRCGLEPEAIERLRGRIGDFWHIAACLKYEDEHREEIELHNVEGTAHALELARALGARRFVYFSTAYTSGAREGLVPEAPVAPGTRHNNYYESTKALAEQLVVRECDAASMPWQILRPAIVVGPQSTHRTGGSSTGFYGFTRELLGLRQALASDDRVITIAGDASIPINLVPVDSVVADMVEVWRNELHQRQGFHHLTCSEPLPLGEVMSCICEHVGVRPLRLVPDHAPSSPIERAIDRRLDFYRSYLRAAKSFVRSLPGSPRLTLADITRYTEQFIAEQPVEPARAELARPRRSSEDPSCSTSPASRSA